MIKVRECNGRFAFETIDIFLCTFEKHDPKVCFSPEMATRGFSTLET